MGNMRYTCMVPAQALHHAHLPSVQMLCKVCCLIVTVCLQTVFDGLKQQMSLHSLADSKMLQSEEHMETAVLMLGTFLQNVLQTAQGSICMCA